MYYVSKRENVVNLTHSAHREHEFLVKKTKEMSKSMKIAPRKEVAMELLHHILGHRSTRSLMDGDTTNAWQDIEIRIDLDPFFTSRQTSSTNKSLVTKIH